MLLENQHPLNKSIMVSVLGAPNVGKSSLINYLLGMDLSVVTNRAQTTRNRINCIFTIDHTEIILIDTPGLHNSNKEFNKRMNQQAVEGTDGVDLNLILIDISKGIMDQLSSFKNNFENELGKTWIVFSKSDKMKDLEALPFDEIVEQAKTTIPSIERHFVLSSKTGDNVHLLTGAICDTAESGPHLYTKGEVTNKSERFFATEYIREQAFNLLKEELPYEVAVVIDEYRDFESEDNGGGRNKTGISSHISASILVNRPSQRAIVVGSQGSMIKEIGTRARRKIEAMINGKVFLNLHVKVSPNWFKNNFVLEELGLPRAHNSNRVWKAR